MLMAPFAFALLTTIPPPAVAPRPLLRDAVVAAARQSAVRLERAPEHRRGEPYQLSRRTGMTIAGTLIGAAIGFAAGSVIGPVASHGECPTPGWLWMSITAAGGVAGGVIGHR
jgi:hypothetical protein